MPLRAGILQKLEDSWVARVKADKRVAERASKHLFDFAPLVSMSHKDKDVLRAYMKKCVSEAYSRYVRVTNRLLSGDTKIVPSLFSRNGKCPTRDETIGLLSGGPVNYLVSYRSGTGAFCTEYAGSMLRGYGSRGLQEYNMNVLQHARELHARKGKTIRVLDVGSADAQMLHELKEKMGNRVETHALNPFDEPRFEVDYYHMLAAEYMPAEFRGYFDLIVSNRALEYVLFPHHALNNIVQAIAPGGRAEIGWDDHRLPIIKSPELELCLDGYLGSGLPEKVMQILKREFDKECKELYGPDEKAPVFHEVLDGLLTRHAIRIKTVLAWCKTVVDILKTEGIKTEIAWGTSEIVEPIGLLIQRSK
jgi:SAM-dependent methyltransferase